MINLLYAQTHYILHANTRIKSVLKYATVVKLTVDENWNEWTGRILVGPTFALLQLYSQCTDIRSATIIDHAFVWRISKSKCVLPANATSSLCYHVNKAFFKICHQRQTNEWSKMKAELNRTNIGTLALVIHRPTYLGKMVKFRNSLCHEKHSQNHYPLCVFEGKRIYFIYLIQNLGLPKQVESFLSWSCIQCVKNAWTGTINFALNTHLSKIIISISLIDRLY